MGQLSSRPRGERLKLPRYLSACQRTLMVSPRCCLQPKFPCCSNDAILHQKTSLPKRCLTDDGCSDKDECRVASGVALQPRAGKYDVNALVNGT